MFRFYMLTEGGMPVRESDIGKWSDWFDKTENRRVLLQRVGGMRVSTVFLGTEASLQPPDNPVLWETMVFGGALDRTSYRCSGSREQAEAMHANVVRQVRAYLRKSSHHNTKRARKPA